MKRSVTIQFDASSERGWLHCKAKGIDGGEHHWSGEYQILRAMGLTEKDVDGKSAVVTIEYE